MQRFLRESLFSFQHPSATFVVAMGIGGVVERQKRILLSRRLPVALAMSGVAAWLSLMPGPPDISVSILGWDKAQHALLYAVFAWCWGRALVVFGKNGWVWGGAVAFLFGCLMELMQGLCTETRAADPLDVLANSIGILAAFLAASWWEKRAGRSGASHSTRRGT